ncbi:TrbC/VirB2 family protein [Alcaligenes aquatilis]|uniref:Conjugal transfer protein n=1 Tax=Alcaligenes faecalis TaxID=511 RepID=A0A2U2BNN7_ALCFA|nr:MULTISPECIES: TrbC/VirB2 family protein [Alcaligenes]PWE15624.1 conjugal transfer protein [Alcaligenes faecalis]QXR34693.1 TrbC/VirB2 family protein [Alcaligenes aquatilis]
MFIKQYLARMAQHRIVRHLYQTAVLAILTTSVAHAQVGGLTKARTSLETFRDNLYIILPIACVVVGLVIWVLYAAEIMRKDDAVRWGIGVLGAGSVAEMVVLFWK